MIRTYLLLLCSCFSLLFPTFGQNATLSADTTIHTGAEQTSLYLPQLQGKSIALVVNPTSIIGKQHLVDSLRNSGCSISMIFAPEHGFRGDADAGEELGNSTDARTSIPVYSLYGKQLKPSPESLKGIDMVVFDIQDVGTRCYTYLSTLHNVMEACAEQKKPLLVLDRPNPNGGYIDGPVLDTLFRSFVGLHPVPLVYGMTIGEYALMINGEGWLAKGTRCQLQVISLQHYTHNSRYTLPVKPSPNLNSQQAIYLYPSLCLFEGTVMSVGRGTEEPFRLLGHPKLDSSYQFSFIPKSIPGMSKNPPHEGKACYGIDLRELSNDSLAKQRKLNLSWLIDLYRNYPDQAHFFNAFFQNLAGTDQLRRQIKNGMTETEIRSSWQPKLDKFKEIRSKYLLYN